MTELGSGSSEKAEAVLLRLFLCRVDPHLEPFRLLKSAGNTLRRHLAQLAELHYSNPEFVF